MVNNSRIPMSTMSGDCRGNTYTKIETIQPLCKNDMQICEPSMFKKNIYIYIYTCIKSVFSICFLFHCKLELEFPGLTVLRLSPQDLTRTTRFSKSFYLSELFWCSLLCQNKLRVLCL